MKKLLIPIIALFLGLTTTSLAFEPLEINCEIANLQESPSSARVIYQVFPSDQLEKLEENAYWFKIRCNGSVEGWIHKSSIKGQFVSIKNESTLPKSSSISTTKNNTQFVPIETDWTYTPSSKGSTDPKAEKMVQIAHTKIGCPYVQNQQGPYAFDCSNFIDYLCKQVTEYPQKIDLTNGPQYQINELTYDIPAIAVLSNANNLDAVLNPGDVFYFRHSNESAAQHCALYVGNNEIIHASSAASRVIKEKISDSNLRSTVVVKRVFEDGKICVVPYRVYSAPQ